MTIPPELQSEIVRLYHAEKWRVNTIAKQLRVHHSTVRRVLEQEGKTAPKQAPRPRMIDPYVPFLVETLEKHPTLTASRLFDMAKERGYTGQIRQFGEIVRSLRTFKHNPEPYLRLKTLPGEQAQVDWGHFGRFEVGRASRQLSAFVIVLSYSRAIFVRFFLSQNLSCFMRGHDLAFRWFQGISRVCLYDNLKSVVLERIGNAIRFNPQFMEFAGHYRFEPRAAAIARGNEKGRTERAIQYVRTNFFAARKFRDLDDLNAQALTWCEKNALQRRWPEDTRRTVEEVFLEEKTKLLAIPDNPFPCDERVEVSIGKSPYARFDLNDYSVPHTLVRKTLVVVASQYKVRILDGNEVVATHPRSYSRGEQIEDREHIEGLAAVKRAAGQHRRTNLLSQAAPSSVTLLEKISERGLPLGRVTRELEELLHTYGAEALEAAIEEAIQNHALHLHGIRHILERARKEAGRAPALPLPLPDDPRVKNLVVTPHSLQSYDQHIEEEENSNDNNNKDN